MKEYKPSDVTIMKRVPKSVENPFGIIAVKKIPTTKPVLFIFGGDATLTSKNANNYASIMNELLKENGLNDVNIFSLYYKFNSRDNLFDKVNVFKKANRKIHISDFSKQDIKETGEKEPVPAFIEKLFNILIAPRILDKNGKKLSTEKSMKNMLKLKIFSHCYGSTILKYFEEYIKKQMLKLGFSNDDVNSIQKQVLVIAHAPYAPLQQSGFTTLSFVSAQDEVLNHHNLFNMYIKSNHKKLKPSFFEYDKGNVVMANKTKKDDDSEHFTSGIATCAVSTLSDDGKLVYAAERNAIVNGIKSSIRNEPMPSMRELMSGNDVNFDDLSKNGEDFYNTMVTELRQQKQNLKHVHQK